MPRLPEIGSIQLYPQRPLRKSDKNGYVLKFYCPLRRTRIRKNCGTRDRREARRILRECRERLLNGEYLNSDGAITSAQAELMGEGKRLSAVAADSVEDRGKTWEECFDRYRQHRMSRSREKSLVDSLSRLQIIERICQNSLGVAETGGVLFVREVMTLDCLERIQERLLSGEECRYAQRSPNTVNSMLGAFMAFVRFCHKHEWIEKVPQLEKIESRDVMKGRPITAEEFVRMLRATRSVVGREFAREWRFALRILWESGFRIGELLQFSWDDDQQIHPVWPAEGHRHPTIIVPPTQKNRRLQEIPLLPGLHKLLMKVPESCRQGNVVSLRLKSKFTEQLSVDCISRTIARIGQQANVVVKKASAAAGTRTKYASAHDLRRGCAAKLINAGVSAETLKVVMRHADFGTTEKHYGAIRSAQSAAKELHERLT